MGKSNDAPAPPDPKETAAASTSTNVSTAIANANLGNVNQVTPDGTLSYTQTGTYKQYDPYTGKTYDIPRYTATQTLSAAQQAIKDQTNGAQLNLAGIAKDQSAFLKDYLGKPVDLSNDATEARLMELGRQRLDPILAQRRESQQADLANQGVRMGSTAYDNAMSQLGQSENDQYTSLLLNGRAQSVQEALTQRNQPINEIIGLMGGSQVSQPNFVNSNMPTIPTTDVAGLINTNYNQKMGAYQQQQAQSNSMLGGLFGLGSSLIMASDRRLKRNVRRIGRYANGMPKYSYEYVWGGGRRVGVMSDDVRKVRPDAVTRIDGYDAVNYEKALA